ncbi:MAG: Na+/H+ antiporter subunit E [Ilumatobacter sp.]|uniref:Na+/H+ antiporter subunit E n=1 Tax=Ilumatobacter sp. TaxID=1967498 RepID=UPI0032999D57
MSVRSGFFPRLADGSAGLFSVRRFSIVVLLTLAWCALWGSVSAANLISGLIVSSAASFAGANAPGGVRPWPLVRLLWVVALDLVVSTAVVVREVLTPTDHTEEAIIRVSVPLEARSHLLFLYIAITVTPGTAVVAGDDDASAIYLHVLHADRRDAIVEHVELLVLLVNQAFPVAVSRRVGEVAR